MFSGCSIQSLWATPACVSVSDRLEREASSGAWKTQTNFNKAVTHHRLKKEKEKRKKKALSSSSGPLIEAWELFPTLHSSGHTFELMFMRSHQALGSSVHIRGPWSFPTFLPGPSDVHVPSFLMKSVQRHWRCALISGTRRVTSSCFYSSFIFEEAPLDCICLSSTFHSFSTESGKSEGQVSVDFPTEWGHSHQGRTFLWKPDMVCNNAELGDTGTSSWKAELRVSQSITLSLLPCLLPTVRPCVSPVSDDHPDNQVLERKGRFMLTVTHCKHRNFPQEL